MHRKARNRKFLCYRHGGKRVRISGSYVLKKSILIDQTANFKRSSAASSKNTQALGVIILLDLLTSLGKEGKSKNKIGRSRQKWTVPSGDHLQAFSAFWSSFHLATVLFYSSLSCARALYVIFSFYWIFWRLFKHAHDAPLSHGECVSDTRTTA